MRKPDSVTELEALLARTTDPAARASIEHRLTVRRLHNRRRRDIGRQRAEARHDA